MKASKVFIIILIVIGGIGFYALLFHFSIANLSKSAIDNFAQGDTLKKRSVDFLLENSTDKYTKTYLDIHIPDKIFIKKTALFHHINETLKVSKKRLEDNIFTEEQFLNYILPYRIRYEFPEDWMSLGVDSFGACCNEDIFIHCKNINDRLRSKFVYEEGGKANRKFSDLLLESYGICYEMSDMAAFAMRANGIPVAIDFAKWANIRGRHQWNSLQTKEKNIPFMGIESDPAIGNTKSIIMFNLKKAAKVYRKTFQKYEDKYKEYNPKKEINEVNYIDVTKEYYPDCKEIVIDIGNEQTGQDVFFLCIYDKNNWVPVDFAYRENNTLQFKDVSLNNIFILKKRKDTKLDYFKTPFTFDKNGEIAFLQSNPRIKETLKLTYDNSNDREYIRNYYSIVNDSIRDAILLENKTAKIKKGSFYSLFYWNKEWLLVGEQKAKNDTLVFSNAPENALYKLEEKNDSNAVNNRCFTIDLNNKQNWW